MPCSNGPHALQRLYDLLQYIRTGMTGLDREGCLWLQAEPPSLVKGATA